MAAPYDMFWRKFRAVEAGLRSYDRYKSSHAEWVRDYKALEEVLSRAQPGLVIEIAFGDPAALVVSTQGNKQLFPAAFDCVDEAPPTPGWTFQALRPRRNPRSITSIFDMNIAPDDIRIGFARSEDGKRLHLGFFVRSRRNLDQKELEMATMICLDHLFGEYDVEMRIGAIEAEFVGTDENWPRNLYTVPDAIRAFDTYFASRARHAQI